MEARACAAPVRASGDQARGQDLEAPEAQVKAEFRGLAGRARVGQSRGRILPPGAMGLEEVAFRDSVRSPGADLRELAARCWAEMAALRAQEAEAGSLLELPERGRDREERLPEPAGRLAQSRGPGEEDRGEPAPRDSLPALLEPVDLLGKPARLNGVMVRCQAPGRAEMALEPREWGKGTGPGDHPGREAVPSWDLTPRGRGQGRVGSEVGSIRLQRALEAQGVGPIPGRWGCPVRAAQAAAVPALPPAVPTSQGPAPARPERPRVPAPAAKVRRGQPGEQVARPAWDRQAVDHP